MSQSINNLIRKLEALPPSASLEWHNGQLWIKFSPTRYQRLVDFVRVKSGPTISPLREAINQTYPLSIKSNLP